jgi:hypothetical protein
MRTISDGPRSSVLVLALLLTVQAACVSTSWIEVPHPSQVEAGSHVRVTAGGESFELFNVFVVDDSLLVGERAANAPAWAIAPDPIPFSSIQKLEEVDEREVREMRTVATVLAVGAGVVLVGFFMLVANFGT